MTSIYKQQTPVVRSAGARILVLTVVAKQMCPWKDMREEEKFKTVWSALPLASCRVPRQAKQGLRDRSVEMDERNPFPNVTILPCFSPQLLPALSFQASVLGWSPAKAF